MILLQLDSSAWCSTKDEKINNYYIVTSWSQLPYPNITETDLLLHIFCGFDLLSLAKIDALPKKPMLRRLQAETLQVETSGLTQIEHIDFNVWDIVGKCVNIEPSKILRVWSGVEQFVEPLLSSWPSVNKSFENGLSGQQLATWIWDSC